jgi:hypothetical protein
MSSKKKKKKSEIEVAKRRKDLRARLPHLELDVASRTAAARRASADLAARAYRTGVGRALAPAVPVTSAAQGRALLAAGDHPEVLSDQMQKIALAAVPLVRLAKRTGRFARVPSVVVATTALSAGMTVRRGVREVQVVAALVEHGIEQATGGDADPELVQALAVALYLDPKKPPQPTRGRVRVAALARRWAWRGTLGWDTGEAANRALEAAERLDYAAEVARWTAAAPGG